MKLIELRILQSYPVSCLNHDEVGSPQSATPPSTVSECDAFLRCNCD